MPITVHILNDQSIRVLTAYRRTFALVRLRINIFAANSKEQANRLPVLS